MKYNYKIYEASTNAVVLKGTTNGRGTRKDQEADIRIIAIHNGIYLYSNDNYKLLMKATN